MKLTLTNGKAEAILTAVNSVGNSSAINGMLAYKLAKITSSIKREIQPYAEAKNSIIEKYSEEGKITDQKKANEEWFEIRDEEIEIEFKPLTEEDFEMLECTVQQAETLLEIVD